MQKVLENRCQSCKKSDNIWGKYTSRAISPIYYRQNCSKFEKSEKVACCCCCCCRIYMGEIALDVYFPKKMSLFLQL